MKKPKSVIDWPKIQDDAIKFVSPNPRARKAMREAGINPMIFNDCNCSMSAELPPENYPDWKKPLLAKPAFIGNRNALLAFLRPFAAKGNKTAQEIIERLEGSC